MSSAVDRRGIGALAVGHLASDFCQGCVPALLPFLIRDRGYSYAAAGGLFLIASLGSSLIQPVLGHHADQIASGWLMPAGALLGGVGIALAGVLESYWACAAGLLVGGVGVAAFHPEGARFASYVSGDRRATGMSLFSVGGNAGFALGPIAVTACVGIGGLGTTPFLFLIPLTAALVLTTQMPYLERFRPALVARHERGGADDDWSSFSLAAGVSVARTGAAFGLQAFIPSYFLAELSSSAEVGEAVVSAMLVAGAVGTLVGGRSADRRGDRVTMVWSLALFALLCAALPVVPLAGVVVLIVACGLVMDASYSPTVVLAQGFLARRVGLASGITLGLSVGAGALCVWLLGLLADAAGLRAALVAITGLAVCAWALALALPREAVRPRSAPSGPRSG